MIKKLTLLLAVPFLLSACASPQGGLRTHSTITPNKSQISEGFVTEKYAMSEIGYGDIVGLAEDHGNRGAGPATVMVLYNNGTCPRTSLKLASKQGDIIRDQMIESGAGETRVHATPVDDKLGNRVIVSYRALNVIAPEGCETRMDGLVDRKNELDNSYRLGCENERLIGQMVANPRDLAGRDTLDGDTSQRQGAALERYYDGENLFSGDRTGESVTTGAVEN